MVYSFTGKMVQCLNGVPVNRLNFSGGFTFLDASRYDRFSHASRTDPELDEFATPNTQPRVAGNLV
jgi:hypothetical protein